MSKLIIWGSSWGWGFRFRWLIALAREKDGRTGSPRGGELSRYYPVKTGDDKTGSKFEADGLLPAEDPHGYGIVGSVRGPPIRGLP